MKPYMIIVGTESDINQFELKIADALELGYSLAGELQILNIGIETKFYQPILLTDEDDLEDHE